MNENVISQEGAAPPIKPLGLGVFLLVALGGPAWYLLSLLNSGVVIDVEAMQSDPNYAMSMMGTMLMMQIVLPLIPAVGALLARLVAREGFGEGNFKWMSAGAFFRIFFGTGIVLWLAFVITAVTGLATVDQTAGGTAENPAAYAAALAGQLAIGPLIGMLFVIPSAWGWLSYFYTRMAGIMAPQAAALLTAIPQALLAVIGVRIVVMGDSVGPTQLLVANMVNAVAFGLVAAWLFRRLRSIWAAALFSAVAGVNLQTPDALLTDTREWLGAPYGAVMWAVMAVACWRVWQADWNPISQYTEDPADEEDDWDSEDTWTAEPAEPAPEGSTPEEPPSKE